MSMGSARYVAPMRTMVAPLLAHRDMEAYGCTMWVLGQRNVVNIDIDRSIMRYMEMFNIKPDQFEWLRRRYFELIKDMQHAEIDTSKCKDCPKPAAA